MTVGNQRAEWSNPLRDPDDRRMPRIAGPQIEGLTRSGAQGFIPIDGQCRVPRTQGRVFAAWDATTFPVKHGGLGAQQADAAAAAIAVLAGAGARWRRSSRRSGGSCSPELSRST